MYQDSTLQDIANKPSKIESRLHRPITRSFKQAARSYGNNLKQSEIQSGIRNETFKSKKMSLNIQRKSSTQLTIHKDWRSDHDKKYSQSQHHYNNKPSYHNNYCASSFSKSSIHSNTHIPERQVISSLNEKLSSLSSQSLPNSKRQTHLKRITTKKIRNRATKFTENKQLPRSKSGTRQYRVKAPNQNQPSDATASVLAIPVATTEAVVELKGTFTTEAFSHRPEKGPKYMKYIQQKVIPTDKTLKCENGLNDTMMNSTSVNPTKQPSGPNSPGLGQTDMFQKVDDIHKKPNFDCRVVSEFVARPYVDESEHQRQTLNRNRFEKIKETDPIKEDTNSHEQTNEIEDFDNLFCKEEFPQLHIIPTRTEISVGQQEDDGQDQSVLSNEGCLSHIVTDDDINNSSRQRNEVYKSEVALMSKRDRNSVNEYGKASCIPNHFPGHASIKVQSMPSNQHKKEEVDIELELGVYTGQEENDNQEENEYKFQDDYMVAAEGHARDAAYFSRDQNNPSLKSQSPSNNKIKACHLDSQFSRNENEFDLTQANQSNKHNLSERSLNRPSFEKNLKSDRQKIQQLKSPKPEKNLKIEWQLLIDEALNNEDDDDDNDEPFDPNKFSNQNIEESNNQNYSQVQNANDNSNCCKKSIYINSQKANSLKGCDKYQAFTGSEGMTDHSCSPLKSPEILSQALNSGNSFADNHLRKGEIYKRQQMKRKHYYDPHEPHSAIPIPTQKNSIVVLKNLINNPDENSRNQSGETSSINQCKSLMLGKRETNYQVYDNCKHLHLGQNNSIDKDQSNKSDCNINRSSRSTSDRKRESNNKQDEDFDPEKQVLQAREFISKVSSCHEIDQSFESPTNKSGKVDTKKLDLQYEDSQEIGQDALNIRPYEDVQIGNNQIIDLFDQKQQSQVDQFHKQQESDRLLFCLEDVNANDQPENDIGAFERKDEVDLVEDGFFEKLMQRDRVNSSSQDPFQFNMYQDFDQFKDQDDSYHFDDLKKIQNNQIDLQNQSQTDNNKSNVLDKQKQSNLSKEISNNIKLNYRPQEQTKLSILNHMLEKESKIRNKEKQILIQNDQQSIFQRQIEFTPQMRIILLDWMCQVSSDYCLKRATFHLALQLVDNYLLLYPKHIGTNQFQLIGVTCLHMAAKVEEIYPPHINAFVESTNNSVTQKQMIEQEFFIGEVLAWNFSQFMTMYDWSTWYMKQWDQYVDSSLSYLKQQFNLKFFDNSPNGLRKYLTVMQFTDAIAIDYQSQQFSQRQLVACLMYLILGGKDIMCAFQFDYHEMPLVFETQLPIQGPDNGDIKQATQDRHSSRLPEGILFYNQIIQPFFVNEFCMYLHDLYEPLKYVIKFLKLDISQVVGGYPHQLVKQCQMVIQQYDSIVMEKFYAFRNNGTYPGLQLSELPRSYTEDEMFAHHFNELVSFQNFNHNSLDLLKELESNRSNPIQTQIEIKTPQDQELNNTKSDEVAISGKVPKIIECTSNSIEDLTKVSQLHTPNSQLTKTQQDPFEFKLQEEEQEGEIDALIQPPKHDLQEQSQDKGTFISLNIQHRSSNQQSHSGTHSIYQNSDERRAIKEFQSQNLKDSSMTYLKIDDQELTDEF